MVLARPILAKANFGQSNFGGPEGWGPEGWGPEGWRRVGPRRVGPPPRVGGQTQKKWGPEVVGPRRVGARRVGPRRVGPRRVGPRRVGAQNFALFFPLPSQFFIFSLSFGLFREILVVFEAPVRSNVHVWSSRAVVCEPRRPGLVGPQGVSHDNPRGSRSSKTQSKFNEKDQQEREKGIKNCGGRGKKRAKFWAVRRRGSSGGGPAERP